MVISVKDSRVYLFSKSTIVCDIYEDRAEILVLPDRRRFILRLKRDACERLQQAYPERTPQNIIATLIANALKDGFLQVDEEVFE